MSKRRLLKFPIPILIAIGIILAGGGVLIYALTKSTEAAGPVGYWKLDEGAGTVAYDASGNANDGTLTNFDFDDTSNWTTGKVAGALKFDGVDDYVSIPNSDSIKSSLPITIEVWVKHNITDTNGRVFSSDDVVGLIYGYNLFVSPTGIVGTGFGDGTGTGAGNYRFKTTAASMATAGVWHHIVGVINGATDMSIFVDGQDKGGTYTGTGGDMVYGTGVGIIGNWNTLASRRFSGLIDDVRIYNRALSPDEVRWNFNRGGPVGWWKFDDGSNSSTTYDSSGNGNNGTIYGATSTTGKINSALSFDGTDDYVDAGSGASLDITEAITIEAWVQWNAWNAVGSNYSMILQKDSAGTYQYGMGVRGSNLRYNFGDSYLDGGVISPVLQLGTWYHFAITSVKNGTFKFYLNGVEKISGSGPTSVSSVGNVIFGHAVSAGFGTNWLNGLIDDVRIYNYARTAAEIRTDYNFGQAVRFGTGDYDLSYGLVGHWTMDEGSGYTAHDSSNNSNDGALTNFNFNKDSNWTSGKVAGSLRFDGTNDYVQTTISESTTTIALWVENSGVWQHVVNVNGTEYVNGVTGTPTSYPIYFSGTTVQIGKTAVSTYFSGKIDDVRVYNRALSADEIRYLYNRKGPVGWWKFDDGSNSSTTYDSSGNGNNGTINGATSTVGKINSALSFDGTDDYVNAGNDTSLNTPSALTVLVWVKGGAQDFKAFVTKSNSSDSKRSWLMLTERSSDTGGTTKFIAAVSADGGAVNMKNYTSSIEVFDNTWHQVGFVFNAGTLNLYADGKLDTNPTKVVDGTVATLLTTTKTVKIGCSNDTPSAFFTGLIDDVRIYNYTRTAAEIRTDYNEGFAAKFGPSDSTGIDLERGLVSRWKFEEGSGYKAYDSSNGGNDGTLYNFDFNRDSGWTSGNPSAGSGQALKFDGSNDYMETTVSESTTTVAFWVQNSGTWQHVVNSDGTEYVNGVTGSPTSYPIYFSGTTLQIGKTAVSTYFSGKIDDVRIYNRALSADEIRYLYNRKQPIGWWKFDSGNSSGTLAYDSSINGNHGTIYGASSTEGKINRALSFDGTDDYVDAGNDSSVSFTTSDFSISMWMKANVAGTSQTILSRGSYRVDGWFLVRRETNAIQLWTNQSGAAQETDSANNSIAINTWYFITVTRVGSSVKIYINGQEATYAVVGTHINPVSSSRSVKIGTNDGLSSLFNGLIDDVRIYNYARTAEEIRTDYNAGFSTYFK